jgi:hypothetical protein
VSQRMTVSPGEMVGLDDHMVGIASRRGLTMDDVPCVSFSELFPPTHLVRSLIIFSASWDCGFLARGMF